MELVIDPREIRRLAEQREDENWDFRNWIKSDFRAANASRISSTLVCPIVFNVVEGIKVALHWSRQDHWSW